MLGPIGPHTDTWTMRNLARLSRCCARAIIRFGVAQRGTTAVEFAFVAPLLIALLVAIFQVTFFLFAQMNLQNAAVSVGRLIMTGQVQNAGTSQANFLDQRCLSVTWTDVHLRQRLRECAELYQFQRREHDSTNADLQRQWHGQ